MKHTNTPYNYGPKVDTIRLGLPHALTLDGKKSQTTKTEVEQRLSSFLNNAPADGKLYVREATKKDRLNGCYSKGVALAYRPKGKQAITLITLVYGKHPKRPQLCPVGMQIHISALKLLGLEGVIPVLQNYLYEANGNALQIFANARVYYLEMAYDVRQDKRRFFMDMPRHVNLREIRFSDGGQTTYSGKASGDRRHVFYDKQLELGKKYDLHYDEPIMRYEIRLKTGMLKHLCLSTLHKAPFHCQHVNVFQRNIVRNLNADFFEEANAYGFKEALYRFHGTNMYRRKKLRESFSKALPTWWNPSQMQAEMKEVLEQTKQELCHIA